MMSSKKDNKMIDIPSREGAIDYHVHTKYSACSNSEIKDVIRVAVNRGLSGIAITDHNTMRGVLQAKSDKIKIIRGMEIKCQYGEMLCLYLNEEIKSRDFWEVADIVKEQGGKIFIAHPFDPFRTPWKNWSKELLKKIDGIEDHNGRCFFNSKAVKFAKEKNLRTIQGSDAHTLSEIGSFEPTVFTIGLALYSAFLRRTVNLEQFRNSK